MPERFDTINSELLKPIKTGEGFLKAQGVLARTGVLGYRRHDGSVRYELLPPEELFDPASLSTLGGKPIVDDHPTDDRGAYILVDAENASELVKGTVSNTIHPDRARGLLKVDLDIHDGPTIDKVDAGKRQLSSGRVLREIEPTPGVWDHVAQKYYTGADAVGRSGVRFDAIQRGLAHNHAAIVERGRAGSKVAIRVDSAVSDVTAIPKPSQEFKPMGTIRVDNADYEAEPGLAAAFARHDNRQSGRIADLEQLLNEAKADKARVEGELAGEKTKSQELQSRMDSFDIREAIKGRMALERKARKLLRADTDLDELSERQIHVASIQARVKGWSDEGMSDDQVKYFFDGLAASVPDQPETAVQTNDGRNAGRNNVRNDGAPGSEVEKARQRFNDRFDWNASKRRELEEANR